MGICYPKYEFLSTGGSIGDALFFFASGFTLFMGRNLRFDNWYKRRINRIYPSLLATAILGCAIFGVSDNIIDVLLGERYWFVGCILIYYIVLYPIKCYKLDGYVMCMGGVIITIIYFLFYNGENFYGGGSFRWFAYFLIMLQGAIIGKKNKDATFKPRYIAFLILSVTTWYILFYLGSDNWLLLLSWIPMMGITKYTYLICNASFFKKLYDSKVFGQIIYIVSQLCLESYLIQKFIISDNLNFIFPFNIPIIFLLILMFAYITKTIAEFIAQTFRTEPYEWSKMLLRK